MALGQFNTNGKLLRRSIFPSAGEGLACFMIALIFILSDIVLQSVNVGTSLPGVLDGQWAIWYTDHVVQPLTTFLSNNTLNKLIVAILWGSAGFIVYVSFEYYMRWRRTLRYSQHDVQMARGQIVERPMYDEFWKTVKWRVGVIIGFVIFLFVMQPALGYAADAVQTFVVSKNLARDSLQIGLAILIWATMLHGIIVGIRLFVQRTRIFGDADLY